MPNLTITCEQQTLRPIIPGLEKHITRLAAHIKLECELVLTPVEARKSGAHTQGLHTQAYEQNDAEPAVLLLYQSSEDNCWLWRLRFPSGTDAQLMYGRLGIAIEKGQHLVDAKKMNGHAGHISPASSALFSDEQLATSAKAMERSVGQGEIANLIVVELRNGLGKDQVEFSEAYALSRLLRADSHYKGDTARVVLRAITNRLLVNSSPESGMYRFGARGNEILQAYDLEQARQKAQEDAEAAEARRRASTVSPARIKSPDWVDDESPDDQEASLQRASMFTQNPDNVALSLRFICSHGDWSTDAAPVLRRGHALDKIVQCSRETLSRRDAGRVLKTFSRRGYFEYYNEGDLIQINPAGIAMARSCRIGDVPAWARPFRGDAAQINVKEKTPATRAEPVRAHSTPVVEAAEVTTPKVGPDYIRDLTARVAKFDAATKVVETAEKRIGEINQELSELETKTAILKAERQSLATSLVESRVTVADSQYQQAVEELKSIRAMLELK